MHCVIETKAFEQSAADAGLSEDEVFYLINWLSENPQAGAVIPGTGGCRKLRIPLGGKGKRGGARVITFYSGEEVPLFLLTVFGKGEKTDLSKGERNALGKMTKELVAEYRSQRKVVRIGETA